MSIRAFWRTAAAVAVLASASAAAAQAWQTYTNTDLGFSVETPGVPQMQTTPVATAAGNMQMTGGIIDLGARGGLMVSVADYSALMKGQSVAADKLLEGAVQGSLKETQSTLDSEKTITVEGEPGRDIVSHNAQFVGRARIVLHHNRIYMALGVGDPAQGAPAEYDRFAQSLHFLP